MATAVARVRRKVGQVKTKRWNDAADPDDGHRVLVCRYRPRGVRKADETWHAWMPDLGPSPDLIADFLGKRGRPIGWGVYRRRYLAEMRGQRQRIAELARRIGAGEAITLLCASSCVDPDRCHRKLLRDLVLADAAAGGVRVAPRGRGGRS